MGCSCSQNASPAGVAHPKALNAVQSQIASELDDVPTCVAEPRSCDGSPTSSPVPGYAVAEEDVLRPSGSDFVPKVGECKQPSRTTSFRSTSASGNKSVSSTRATDTDDASPPSQAPAAWPACPQLSAELPPQLAMAAQQLWGLTLGLELFQAQQSLQDLIQEAKSALEGDIGPEARAAVRELLELLKEDKVLTKLSRVVPRMRSCLSMLGLVPACGMPSGGGEWAVITVSAPEIHPKYTLQVILRYLDAEERSKGSSNQVVLMINARYWPLNLAQGVAVNGKEADVHKPNQPHIDSYEGVNGDAEQLFSSMLTLAMRPLVPVPMLPREQRSIINEFAVCATPPHPHLARPGVLKIEHSAPEGVRHHEGWDIPPLKSGYKLQKSVSVLQYLTASEGHPECHDMSTILVADIPIPKWAMPMSLLQKLGPNVLRSSIRAESKVLERWPELGFQARIDADETGFYSAVKQLMKAPDTDEH